MRKQDIKPGVLYAQWREHLQHDRPVAIVFLAAPGDGLWQYVRRNVGGAPVYRRAEDYEKPGRQKDAWSVNGDVGYPVAMLGSRAADPGALLSVTLDDFKAATHMHGEHVKFDVLTTLTGIWGTWDDAQARYAEIRAARAAAEDVEQARQDAGRAAADELAVASGCAALWADNRVVISAASARLIAARLKATP